MNSSFKKWRKTGKCQPEMDRSQLKKFFFLKKDVPRAKIRFYGAKKEKIILFDCRKKSDDAILREEKGELPQKVELENATADA